ncbi:hypothetical protein C2S51_009957 [Perilla frutescens var. frutescens]|nr:hypothetical protein C2S51_009957 [Perilla frutescens var. frutescens]
MGRREYKKIVNEIGREPVVYVGQFRCSYASIVVQCGEREEREEKEQVKVEIKSVDGVGEERRIKHYSSRHKILLVGEGDFSFSACLAVAFGSSATNIIATSLDSIAFLKENYGRAMSNIAELRSRGSKTMHEIDATEIANHELLRRLQFDRIIFNFPFAGFFPYLSPKCQLRCHRNLVNLFLKNAKELLSENGEIHVSHKTNGRYHAEFELENIAASHGLGLIDVVKFKCSDYPGYNTKFSSGFGYDPITKKFTASDEVCDAYLEPHSKDANLGYRECPDCEDLEIAIGNGVVVGKNSIGLGSATDAKTLGDDESRDVRIKNLAFDPENKAFVALSQDEPLSSGSTPSSGLPKVSEGSTQRRNQPKRSRAQCEATSDSFENIMEEIKKLSNTFEEVHNLLLKRDIILEKRKRERSYTTWDTIKEIPNLDEDIRLKAFNLLNTK